MIGMTLFHGQSNTTGKVDATSQHPDGKCLVRINDHWFLKDECVEPRPMVWIFIAGALLAGLCLYGLSLI
jgi:hypothetical protein